MGELTESVRHLLKNYGGSKSATVDMAGIEKKIRMEESLKNTIEMYNMRGNCPEYVQEYLETSLRANVHQLKELLSSSRASEPAHSGERSPPAGPSSSS